MAKKNRCSKCGVDIDDLVASTNPDDCYIPCEWVNGRLYCEVCCGNVPSGKIKDDSEWDWEPPLGWDSN